MNNNTNKHTNRELYNKQVETLNLFLEKGVISKQQYDKSYSDLTKKMKFSEDEKNV